MFFSVLCGEFLRSYFPSFEMYRCFLCSSEKLVLLAGGSLEISDVTEDDAGTYLCIADNGNETIEAPAELSVQGI